MKKVSFSITIEELVDEHKVVLDVLLGDLAKVGLHDVDDLEEELKDHGSVDILLGHCGEPYVGPLYVEERGPGDVGNRRPDLLPRVYHVNPEGVDGVPAYVVPVHPGYEHLALVVVHEQPADHLGCCGFSYSGV